MGQTAKEPKSDLEKNVALLQTLRDEARVEVRLRKTEAKDRLEPELEALERATHDASEAGRAAATKGVNALKEFLASL
ncbi:MAG TPA: hypothetical protein VN894_05425 [Polyangiaceae bacterium]|nr:hypothetical protein [Polyangiaceae bacterium]